MNVNSLCVIGLGYVGLPLAIEFCKSGIQVFGLDIDERRLEYLRKGDSYIEDISADDVKNFVDSNRLCPSADFSVIRDVEGISICVPTPLRKTKEPDVSYVIAAAEQISQYLQPGQTVILESTVYPGATESLVAPILEKSGLKAGKDFYLAFSPERIDPGRKDVQLKDIPKVIGGINAESTQRAINLYQRIFTETVPVTSTKEAEMVKLLENTYRAVNIGLIHELAMLSHRLGINIWQVIDAAATKPYGYMPFYPGPGWGGHCIPVDPIYLSWRAKVDGIDAEFIDHAVQINNHMPQYIVERVSDLLNEAGKPLSGSRILLLGVAYKRNVSDVRESPALPILTLLESKQALVSYHDPYIPDLRHEGMDMESCELDDNLLSEQDCIIIMTDHSSFDYEHIIKHAPLVFDTRNATRAVNNNGSLIHIL